MIVVMTQMIYCSNSVNEENTYTGLTALNENFKLALKGIPFVISVHKVNLVSPELESGRKAQFTAASLV